MGPSLHPLSLPGDIEASGCVDSSVEDVEEIDEKEIIKKILKKIVPESESKDHASPLLNRNSRTKTRSETNSITTSAIYGVKSLLKATLLEFLIKMNCK